MPKKPDTSGLSALGKRLERMLEAQLQDMEKDIKAHPDGAGRRYSLMDHTRVMDRAIKLEAIRAKMDTEKEGDFFAQPPDEGEEDDGPK